MSDSLTRFESAVSIEMGCCSTMSDLFIERVTVKLQRTGSQICLSITSLKKT